MELKEKIELIKKHKDTAIAALNSILDQTYNLTDRYFDEKGNLKKGLTKDQKLEGFIKSLRGDTKKYEKVRSKLIKDDFNLSLFEVNLVGLSFLYISLYWGKQIEVLTKTKAAAEVIFKGLVDKESEKIDFSEEE